MLNITSGDFAEMICSPAMSAVEVSSAVTAQPKAVKSKKKKSVADTIRAGIRAGKANEAILKEVHKKHKGCKTTMACVYWYQSRFNRGSEK